MMLTLMTEKSTKVAVLGSINMDLVVRCARLPDRGETILAQEAAEVCGGKGANQAVQAALAGAAATMIGRVGDDAIADRLLQNLERHGVDTQFVSRSQGCGSGLAIVAVERSGENSILVVPGANGLVSVEDVDAAAMAIENADILLVQLEIPMSAVLRGIQLAREAGVRVIVDPAPAPRDAPAELLQVDLICPNLSEAGALLGTALRNDEQMLVDAARELQQRGARSVAITLGAAGALLLTGQEPRFVPPIPTPAVDTTAAGDAFAGALAVFWGEGAPLEQAVQWANAAGAISASRAGAQPSMGSRDQILQQARHTSP